MFPIVLLLNLNPTDNQFITTTCIGVVYILVAAIMFAPKVVAVYNREKLDWGIKHSGQTATSKENSNQDSVERNTPNVSLNRVPQVPVVEGELPDESKSTKQTLGDIKISPEVV